MVQLAAPDSPFFATIAISKWQALLTSGLKPRRAWPDGIRNIEAFYGLNFERDVLPWVGQEAAMTLQADGVMVTLATRSARKAKACLAKMYEARRRAGDPIAAADVQGVSAYVAQPVMVPVPTPSIFTRRRGAKAPIPAASASPPMMVGTAGYAFALVDDVVVYTGSSEALSAIIARKRAGGPSLAESPTHAKIVAALPKGRLGYAFLAGKPLARHVAATPQPAAPKSAIPDWRTAAPTVPAYFLGAGAALVPVKSTSVRLELQAHFDLETAPATFKNSLEPWRQPVDPKLQGDLPADTVVAGACVLPSSMGAEVPTPDGRSEIAGELAFGILPEPDPPLPGAWPVSALVRLKPTELVALQRQLERATSALSGGRPASREAIGGLTWQMPFAPDGRPMIGYAVAGDTLTLAIGPRTAERLGGPGYKPLSSDPRYVSILNQLPKRNGGIFFMDVKRTGEAVTADYNTLTTMLKLPQPAMTPVPAPAMALGIGGKPGIGEDGIMRSTIVFATGPVRR